MEDAASTLESRLTLGRTLLAQLEDHSAALSSVDGLGKLDRGIRKEIRFLHSLQAKKASLSKEDVASTNLYYFEGIVTRLLSATNPVAVLKPFKMESSYGKSDQVVVDVVSDDGKFWTNVVARNPLALDAAARGLTKFGSSSMVQKARKLAAAAAQNEAFFSPPKVSFFFQKGVSDDLRQRLVELGIDVLGDRVEGLPLHAVEMEDDSESDDELSEDDEALENADQGVREEDSGLDASTLNLDVTTLIGYVSALCNGHCDHSFSHRDLDFTASLERRCPLKPRLEKIFEGKKLVCCQSAADRFTLITETIGGPGEKERAALLMAKVEVVPDLTSERVLSLKLSNKFRGHARAVFGTGDSLRVLTVSANSSFVRAARSNGVDLAVILHDPRVMSESKMSNAIEGK